MSDHGLDGHGVPKLPAAASEDSAAYTFAAGPLGRGTAIPAGQPTADPAPPVAATSPLFALHQLLRGRYLWAIALALVLGPVGAFVGYRLDTPKYRSTGLVRLRPSLPRIMFSTEQNAMMPAYESFVYSQVALITSPRVIDRAAQAALQKPGGRRWSAEQFAGALTVNYPQGREYITVSFLCDDPEAARVAVESAIGAYLQVYEETDVDGKRQRQGLEERKLQLTAEVQRLESVISGLAPFGPTAVEDKYAYKRSELNKLESAMRRVEITIAALDTAPTGPATASGGPSGGKVAPGAAAVTQPSRLGAADAAVFDPEMRQLLQDLHRAEWAIRRLRLRNVGERNIDMEEARAQLEFVQAAIDERLDQIGPGPGAGALPPPAIAAHGGGAASGGAGAAAGAGGVDLPEQPLPLATRASLPALRQQLQNMTTLYERTQKEVADLAELGTKVHTLAAEADASRRALDETKARMEALDVESGVGGRISVLSEADRPSAPDKDRRKIMGVAGGMGGAGAGVGLVLLVGLLDRRLRYVADAEARWGGSVPVLGVLPELPREPTTDPRAGAAARAVHHVRALLQIHSRATGDRVFAVTSPSAGAGKTSFTIALGVSLAASGSRTLLVDWDMVGGGLSSGLRGRSVPRRKLGSVMRHLRLLGARQLEEALRVARTSRRRLGEVAMDLGYVTAAGVERALAAQRLSEAGLLDAVGGAPLLDCVAETGVPGLLVLPLGGAGPQDGSRLSPAAARRLMEDARLAFDVVLVDTGPVLGSVEAPVVASQSDQVLLVLARGERGGLAERSLERLAGAGARVAGVVFNRARVGDSDAFVSSSYGSSSGGGPSRRRKHGRDAELLPMCVGPADGEADAAAHASAN